MMDWLVQQDLDLRSWTMKWDDPKVMYPTNHCLLYKENTFKIITEKEFIDTCWYYSDGTQPISNGEACYVLNKEQKPRVFISCCGNCGDYNVFDMIDMTLEMEEKLRGE